MQKVQKIFVDQDAHVRLVVFWEPMEFDLVDFVKV
jgi:hypothetical protein